MKTIILFRHGKSDWDADYGGDDHERPLADRGTKGARKMGRFLVTAGVMPDRAITSSALRTRQTLAVAAEHGGWAGEARITEALYGARAEDVVREIRAEPDTAQSVVVVGHEPTLSNAVSLLIGGGRVEMRTATMARIDVDVARWADVHPGMGALVWMMPPGALRPNRYRKLQEAMRKAKEAAAEAADVAAQSAEDDLAPVEPPAGTPPPAEPPSPGDATA